MRRVSDIITPAEAGTLAGLFQERVRRTPDGCAYRLYDLDQRRWRCVSWAETACMAARWQAALRREGLQSGERVALMLRNSLEWVFFDLAALGLGLVTVPLYVNDRPDNFAMIIEETGARLLFIEGAPQWERVCKVLQRLGCLKRIVSLSSVGEGECESRPVALADWLKDEEESYDSGMQQARDPASIVYTSGTGGSPKGVTLSHANILANAHAGLNRIPVYSDDIFLSFLPLSHSLERTVGYYGPIMAGASVAHVRSLERLADDLAAVRPTVIVAVPRIFERLHKRIAGRLAATPPWKQRLFDLTVAIGWQRFLHGQGQAPWTPFFLLWPLFNRLIARQIMALLGGRLRLAISGGAPLNPKIARIFIALGLDLLQGYGLTEASPGVSVNTPGDNHPLTVGQPLPGVEVTIGDESELLIRGANVMAGYWANPVATAAAIDQQGWLHTGDQAGIDVDGHITITGRIKDVIVLANGEKVSPAEIEMALVGDRLFDQALVLGEGRPFLTALLQLNQAEWGRLAAELASGGGEPPSLESEAVQQALLDRIDRLLAAFPGYARIRRVAATLAPWELQDGLMTATLKLRRKQLMARYADEIEGMYEGH